MTLKEAIQKEGLKPLYVKSATTSGTTQYLDMRFLFYYMWKQHMHSFRSFISF